MSFDLNERACIGDGGESGARAPLGGRARISLNLQRTEKSDASYSRIETRFVHKYMTERSGIR